jgi:hypothetical protein
MERDAMGCREEQTILLSKYVDNELTGEERQEVETHLGGCNNCKELLSIFLRNESLLSNALAKGIYQDDIVSKVMDRIENPPEVEPADESRWESLIRISRENTWVPLTTAAILLVGFSLFISQPWANSGQGLEERISQLENSIQNYQQVLTDQGKSNQKESEALLSRMEHLNQELVKERIQNASVDIPGNSTAAFFYDSVGVSARFDKTEEYLSFEVHRSDDGGKSWLLKKSGLQKPLYEDPAVKPGAFYLYKFVAWKKNKGQVESVPVRLQAPILNRLDESKYFRIRCTEIGPNLNVASFAITRLVGTENLTYHFTVLLGKKLGRVIQTPQGKVDFSTGLTFNTVEMGDQTLKVTFAWPKFDTKTGDPIWKTAGQQDYDLRDQILSIRENRRAVLESSSGNNLKVWRDGEILVPLP